MKTTSTIIGIVIIVILVGLYNSIFVVSQWQRALTLRLGELTRDANGKAIIYQPGLHFKIPFIMRDIKLDIRIQNLDAESSRIPTDQQKYLLVDYYAKWKITNPALYYIRTGGYPQRAIVLLKQKINDALRAAFGKRSLKDVVSAERTDIMNIIKRNTNESANELGVAIIDTRIKGIDLLQQVQDSVFQRMRTQREQVATQYRYQGRAQAEKIRSDADAKARIMLATAKKNAEITRATGDAEAAAIYTQAYGQDPKFYAFYRSLQVYQQVFTKNNTVLLLKPTDPLLRYLHLSNKKGKAAKNT